VISRRKQKLNIRLKTAILSGSLTLARLASSPQVIEKNTIGMNEIREAQNQGKCPYYLAYHDISGHFVTKLYARNRQSLLFQQLGKIMKRRRKTTS